jgi:hypothetical protein
MNWFFYIGGFPLFLGCLMKFWGLKEDIEEKSFSVVIIKLVSMLLLWIWICWKIS